jgi:hypothetical protein
MMTIATRSDVKMKALIAAVLAAPTVEAGATLALQGVSSQLSEAVGAHQNGDKLALPNFASTLKASTGALVSAICEDVEPTKAQLAVASAELDVAKREVQSPQKGVVAAPGAPGVVATPLNSQQNALTTLQSVP